MKSESDLIWNCCLSAGSVVVVVVVVVGGEVCVCDPGAFWWGAGGFTYWATSSFQFCFSTIGAIPIFLGCEVESDPWTVQFEDGGGIPVSDGVGHAYFDGGDGLCGCFR